MICSSRELPGSLEFQAFWHSCTPRARLPHADSWTRTCSCPPARPSCLCERIYWMQGSRWGLAHVRVVPCKFLRYFKLVCWDSVKEDEWYRKDKEPYLALENCHGIKTASRGLQTKLNAKTEMAQFIFWFKELVGGHFLSLSPPPLTTVHCSPQRTCVCCPVGICW